MKASECHRLKSKEKESLQGGDKITVASASGTLYDAGGCTDSRICYAAVLPVSSTDITLTSVTTTQTEYVNNTVSREVKNATLAANTIYNAFIPYYIDLGDAGKWGYCNVGAFLPEEYGLYFAWGEVNGHNWSGTPNHEGYLIGAFALDFTSFDHSDSRYTGTWNTSSGFANCNTPYYDGNDFSTSKYNTGEGLKVLEKSDDAANVQWGGSWRMPTSAELYALVALDRGWQTDYKDSGVKGKEFENVNTVFFPAAGTGTGMILQSAGNQGYYWSSSLFTGYPTSACDLGISVEKFSTSSLARYVGCSVRPLFSDTK